VGRVDVGQRSETVHRANLSAIVRGLHERGPQSRSELVAATGLTRSAIRTLVGELTDGGLATEDAPVRLGTPGRPSPTVRLIPTGAVVLSFEIMVDSTTAAVVGLGGQTLERLHMDRPGRNLSVDDVVADLVGLANQLRARVDGPIIGIGVAVAGVVRRDDGLVSMAPNLGWVDVPLGARLARALAVAVPIAITNEADAGILAEHRRGAALGIDDAIFISGEVGVGAGILVGGRQMTGVAGYSGEIGHFPVNPDGVSCRCGSVGCLETEAGEGALLARAGRPADGGSADVAAVLSDAEAGSPVALAALDHVGHWLGVGLAGLVNVLNPRLIVLGGLYSRIYPYIVPRIERELDRRTLPAPRALVRITPAMLGEHAPVVGAAELAFEPLLTDPAQWLRLSQPAAEVATA
jgi:predicted NBD/HSP70 family sugar kinase